MPAPAKLVRPVLLASILSGIWLPTVIVPVPSAHARIFHSYSYDELVRKADLIVIASALATEKIEDQEIDTALSGLEEDLEPVSTTFQIDAVLKGDLKAERLSLLHYRFKPVIRDIRNGPRFARFETKGPVFGTELPSGKPFRGPPPSYLLFLKAGVDEMFLPITGHLDSIDSTRRLEDAKKDEPKSVKR